MPCHVGTVLLHALLVMIMGEYFLDGADGPVHLCAGALRVLQAFLPLFPTTGVPSYRSATYSLLPLVIAVCYLVRSTSRCEHCTWRCVCSLLLVGCAVLRASCLGFYFPRGLATAAAKGVCARNKVALRVCLSEDHWRVLAAGYARILQTSSVESQQSSPGYLPYAVSKWALMAMQEQWYSTHAAENVRPSCACEACIGLRCGQHMLCACCSAAAAWLVLLFAF